MSFNAHDLKKAFEDGVIAERLRLLEILKKQLLARPENEDAVSEYMHYVKLFHLDDDNRWKISDMGDIGEL